MQTPHNIDAAMGKNLRGLRTMRGLAQADLGHYCEDKLSAQQISKYELGENQISCSRLVEFTRILDCKVMDFFKGVTAP